MVPINDLVAINLTIPAWQLALYLGLISFFMIIRETRCCLLTTYLYGLYWGYYLFGRDFISAANGYPGVLTAYFGFGLALIGLSLMAIFYEER